MYVRIFFQALNTALANKTISLGTSWMRYSSSISCEAASFKIYETSVGVYKRLACWIK